jgi:hypothetical protein
MPNHLASAADARRRVDRFLFAVACHHAALDARARVRAALSL